MVYPLVRRLLQENVLSEAHWVALNPHAPSTVRVQGMTLHNVAIEGERMGGYGKVKEAIWGRIHEIDGKNPHDELFWSEAFSEYAYYNRRTAELIRELDAAHDFDAFYIHDFQQMPVGQMLATLKPKIFRWHIPFDASVLPAAWKSVLTGYLDSYDVLVVSAARYAASLTELGTKGKVVRLYPYVDPDDYARPNRAVAAAAVPAFGDRTRGRGRAPGRTDGPDQGAGRRDRGVRRDRRPIPPAQARAGRQWELLRLQRGAGALEVVCVANPPRGDGASFRARRPGRLHRASRAGRPRQPVCSLPLHYPPVGPGRVRPGRGGELAARTADDRDRARRDRGADPRRDERSPVRPGRAGALSRKMEMLLNERSGPLRARLSRNGRATSKKCSLDAAETAEREMLTALAEA